MQVQKTDRYFDTKISDAVSDYKYFGQEFSLQQAIQNSEANVSSNVLYFRFIREYNGYDL